jgi:hypothetical protein
MGGDVVYDDKTKTIAIKNNYKLPYYPQRVSAVSASQQKNGYSLKIHSQKSVYPGNEMVEVWANFLNVDDQKKTIYHSNPLLQFYIKDDTGFVVNSYGALNGLSTELSKDDEFMSLLPVNVIRQYNYEKSGEKDYLKVANSSEEMGTLPKGKYTIGVLAEFFEGPPPNDIASINKMTAEIQIEIQ